jgi:allophanate hydrolase
MIRVLKAPGFATVQDRGRPTGRAWGVPQSGAMDPLSLALANRLVGNPSGAAALEWALGTGSLRFEARTAFAATGGDAAITLDERAVATGTTQWAEAGQVLRIGGIHTGRLLYLAVSGGVEVPEVLGSRATYLPARLGGWQGRRLQNEDLLPIGRAAGPIPPGGTTIRYAIDFDQPFALLQGPQSDWLTRDGAAALVTSPFKITPASDRMGTRLAGATLELARASSLASEASCPGAMQLPPNGQPIVLGVDGPTVGGYPKVAVLARAETARFAQQPVGGTVRFRWVDFAEAKRLWDDLQERLRATMEIVR